MSKDHNTITCTHGKGLACPVCYNTYYKDQTMANNYFATDGKHNPFEDVITHDLSQCGDACNCMKCRDTDVIKLLGIFKANPCLDTIELRVGWAMQSPFRDMGVERITEIANSLDIATYIEPQHSMEDSEMVIDPFDAYEPGELPHVPVGTLTFGELEDGTLFYLAQTYAYGGRQKYQKTLEDGGLHNAVLYTESYSGIRVPDTQLVIRA